MTQLYVVSSYRNREEHLKKFVPHMKRYLADFKDHYPGSFSKFEIVIAEQVQPDDERNKLFNRGVLNNCALHHLLQTAAIDEDYICFLDIDTLPVRGGNFLRPPAGVVRHLYGHGFSLSGCIVMRIVDLVAVNGHSNLYQGWGFEDRDFKRRCLRENIEIDHGYFHKRYTKTGFLEMDGNPENLAISRQLVQTRVNGHIYLRAFDHLKDGYQQIRENIDYEVYRQDKEYLRLVIDCHEILSSSSIEIGFRPIDFSQDELHAADLVGIRHAKTQEP